MMYNATHAALFGADLFRRTWGGCSVHLVDGRTISARRVSQHMLAHYQIDAIWNPETEEWIRSDRVNESVVY